MAETGKESMTRKCVVKTSRRSYTDDQSLSLDSSDSKLAQSQAVPLSIQPAALHSVSTSPTLSTTSSCSSQLPNVSDQELAHLSVRQLNQRLQGQDRQLVSVMKQKRRTLKNRGYALNCRVRRIQTQLHLEADNMMLRDQVRCLRQMLADLQTRLAYYEPVVPCNTVCTDAVTPLYPHTYTYS